MKKKILALLCIVSVIASAVFVDFPTVTKATEVKAAETVATVDENEELAYLTLADFSIASGALAGSTGSEEAQTYAGADNLNNTRISFYGNFAAPASGGAYPRIHIGSTLGYSREGIGLLFTATGLKITGTGAWSTQWCRPEYQLQFTDVTVEATDFGLGTTFLGAKFLYEAQMEYKDLDSDGNQNDIVFTLMINKKTVATVEIKDQTNKLGNMFRICDTLTNTSIAGYKELEYTNVRVFDPWTYTDVGGADGEKVNATTNVTLPGGLDKSVFWAKLNFPTTNFGNLYIGAGDWYGLVFTASGTTDLSLQFIATSGDNPSSWNITSEKAGVELRGNADLEMGVSVEFIDVNVAAQTTKLKVGIWINGLLYDGNYLFTSKAVPIADCIKRIHSYALNGVGIYSVNKERNLDAFASYTLEDINPEYTNGNMSGYLPGTSLDKVSYTSWVKYNADSQQFHYATTAGTDLDSNYGGFTLYSRDSRANLVYAKVAGSLPSYSSTTISAQDAIGEDAFTEQFLLRVTTEYVDSDYDGQKDDVKLGLWFNGKLYKNQYFYHVDAVSKVGLRVTANEAGTPKFESYYDKLPAYTKDYVDWTFEHAKFTAGTASGNWFTSSEKMIGESLDKNIFHGYVTFDGSHQRVYIGNDSTYQGIGFVSRNGALEFGSAVGSDSFTAVDTFTLEDCGVSSFAGEKIKLSIATRFVEVVSGTEDAPQIVVEAIPVVNDKLPKGKIYTFTIAGKNFFRKVNVGTNGTIVTENVSCKTKIDDLPKGLTTVHMNDLGLADTVTNMAAGKSIYYEQESFANTIVPFKINFGTSTNTILRFGGKSSIYNSIGIHRTGDKIVVGGGSSLGDCLSKVPNVEVLPEEGQSFANRDIDIHIVTQYMDMDYDGQKDDLKFGVYVDGKLAGGKYFYIYDLAPVLGPCIAWENGGIASITTGGYTEKTLDKSMYTNYTLIDAGIEDGTGQISGKLRDANGVEVSGSAYNKVLFGAKVKFLTESARMHFAAQKDSPMSGMQLRLKGDGNLIVEDYHNWYLEREDLEYASVTVEAEKYLSSGTFTEQEFLLQWTTDIRNLDGDAEADDVLFGLWINGKLVNERYIIIMDSAHLLESYINFNEGYSEFYSLWNIAAPSNEGTEYYKLTDENPYLVIADTFTDAAGKTYTNGSTVTVSGDYTATFEAIDEYLQATTQSIVLWKEWDFSADGVHNVKDLVALKKVAAGMEIPTEAAKMAFSKVDSASRIDDYRGFLAGKVEKLSTDGMGTLRYQTDKNGLVMPIASWVGPTTWSGFNSNTGVYMSDYGLESNFLQTKYYDMIQELGINKLTYVSKDYNSVSDRTILKGLSMAEQYNMQVYVEDTALAYDIADTDEKTAQKLVAERVNAYGRYSSFAGLNVYDEPKSNGIYYAASVGADPHLYIEDIKNKAYLLNSYTNLIGYVNLYPDRKTVNYKKYYPAYLNEYIESCNPKELSYDDYPFSREETVENSKYYFSNLDQIRTAAQNAGIPFIGYIGTGENYEMTQQTTQNIMPTPEQLKWNVNTLLAYGAKGYNWFTLFEPWYFALEGTTDELQGLDANRSGLISATGTKTRHYNTAVAINNWVSEIDHILMEATSETILATGTYAKSNTSVNQSSYNGMTVSAENTTYGAIVGVFTYKGKTAYYVVNNYVKIGSNGTNTGAASQKITLDFGSTSKTCKVYNGATLGCTVTGTSCVLDIEAGGAALVVVD